MKWILAAPVVLALTLPAGARAAFQIPGGGFESPAITANSFAYNAGGGPFTFSGTSGIINNTSAFGSTAAPEGSQVAFLQTNSAQPTTQGVGATGIISTTFTLAAGSYTLSLQDEGRAGYLPSSFSISLDGSTIGGGAPLSTTMFTNFTTGVFTVTSSGSHTLNFTSTGPTDSTTFLDNITLSSVALAVPEPASLAMLGFGMLASGTLFARKTRRQGH